MHPSIMMKREYPFSIPCWFIQLDASDRKCWTDYERYMVKKDNSQNACRKIGKKDNHKSYKDLSRDSHAVFLCDDGSVSLICAGWVSTYRRGKVCVFSECKSCGGSGSHSGYAVYMLDPEGQRVAAWGV